MAGVGVTDTILGFKPKVFVEVGQVIANDNFRFWGAGAGVSKNVYGPVSVSVGYRHREDFYKSRLKQDRFDAGLDYKLSNKWTIGGKYYRYSGLSRKDAVGVIVKYNIGE